MHCTLSKLAETSEDVPTHSFAETIEEQRLKDAAPLNWFCKADFVREKQMTLSQEQRMLSPAHTSVSERLFSPSKLVKTTTTWLQKTRRMTEMRTSRIVRPVPFLTAF